jgi:hypothetical protein
MLRIVNIVVYITFEITKGYFNSPNCLKFIEYSFIFSFKKLKSIIEIIFLNYKIDG